MATSVWALAPEELVQHMVERGEENPKDWLVSLHEILMKDLFDRLVVMVWALSGARRKAIHENIFQSPYSVNNFISSYLGELQLTNARLSVAIASSNARPWTWLATLTRNAKMNVDVVVSIHGFGSVGVICRDHDGMFMRASTLCF
ncbi:hypothetical protein D1007_37361 [Hordeum vulgare]|nr:hypothetical protein D1007_37361 [Hordeum vulgare]